MCRKSGHLSTGFSKQLPCDDYCSRAPNNEYLSTCRVLVKWLRMSWPGVGSTHVQCLDARENCHLQGQRMHKYRCFPPEIVDPQSERRSIWPGQPSKKPNLSLTRTTTKRLTYHWCLTQKWPGKRRVLWAKPQSIFYVINNCCDL